VAPPFLDTLQDGVKTLLEGKLTNLAQPRKESLNTEEFHQVLPGSGR
jgi:hypothetical protein